MVHPKAGVHPARQLSSDGSQSISYICWAVCVLTFETVLVGTSKRQQKWPGASPGLWASHVILGLRFGVTAPAPTHGQCPRKPLAS